MKSYRLSTEAIVMVSGSSAGTQPKYYDKGYWYKVDQNGYEGLSEYLMSLVLSCSNSQSYVIYERCSINGRSGCRSKNFLSHAESFISFQRLYDMYHGGSLSKRIIPLSTVNERIEFVRNFIIDYTGFDCLEYLKIILSLDMLSLNTDRHFNNLGIIANEDTDSFYAAPIFDNGDSLLSNYNKFSVDMSLEDSIESAYCQPFSSNHEVQAQSAGIGLKIDYDRLNSLLDKEPPSRALSVLRYQLDKYDKLLKL